MANLPDLDGGSGGFDPGNGGGGVPGTGTGSSSVPTGFPIGENGGVVASTYFLFVPVQDTRSGQCYIGFFDTTDFNDDKDGSSYSWRQEDISIDAVPTVQRVWITYRDLGPAKFTLTITGTNDNAQIVSAAVVVQIGNNVPTGALFTQQIGLELSAFRPQLSISRNAGDGPISIVRVRMEGEVGDL